MTATNHALTGAIIGLAVGNPVVALPAALASHFVCDAIPHFGYDDSFLKTRTFKIMIFADGLLCVALVLLLAATQPAHWLLAAACAFLATSPDFLWIPLWRQIKQGKTYTLKGFYKFASRIQWFERPIGAVVEAVWLAACLVVLTGYL